MAAGIVVRHPKRSGRRAPIRRVLRRAFRLIRVPLARTLFRLSRAAARRRGRIRHIDGFEVLDWSVALGEQGAVTDALTNLSAAIALLREVDPSLYAQLRREVRVLLLEPNVGTSMYGPEVRVLGVNARHATLWRAEALAAVLAFEISRARIFNRIDYTRPAIAARVARLALDRTVRFLGRLPGEEELADWMRRRFDPALFSHRALLDVKLAKVRALGAPKWLERAVHYLEG